jgi:uncharacterized protein (DUF1330 family)
MGKYIPTAGEAIYANGGELLVMAEESEVLEGSTDFPRTIVVRFETRERAEAFYNSAEYQGILPVRLAATDGYAVIVDGFEMPA